MNLIKIKLIGLQICITIFLILLYTFSISDFMDNIPQSFGLAGDGLSISYTLSFIGIGLGYVYYYISKLKKTLKKYIRLGVPAGIVLILLISYFLFDIHVYFDLLLILAKIGFLMIFINFPALMVFGLLKNKKGYCHISICGGLFFLLTTKILFAFAFKTIDQTYLLLIITGFIFLLQMIFVYFKLVSAKNNVFNNKKSKVEDDISYKFNLCINRYFLYMLLIILSCVLFTFIVYFCLIQTSVLPTEVLNIRFSSFVGISSAVGVTILCILILGLYISQRKE